MIGRPKASLDLTAVQRQELERMARAGTGERRMVFRARLILECATGADNVQVAKRLRYDRTDGHEYTGHRIFLKRIKRH
jgi:hypothetical protein